MGRRLESEDRIMFKMKEFDGIINNSPCPPSSESISSDISAPISPIAVPTVTQISQIPESLISSLLSKIPAPVDPTPLIHKRIEESSKEIKKEIKLEIIKINEEYLVQMQNIVDEQKLRAKIMSENMELENKELRFDFESQRKHCHRDKREIQENAYLLKGEVENIKERIEKLKEDIKRVEEEAKEKKGIETARIENALETDYQQPENRSKEGGFNGERMKRYLKMNNSVDERKQQNLNLNIVTNQDHQFPAVLRINQFKKKVNESLLSLRKRKMRANVEFNLTPEAKRNNEPHQLRELNLNEIKGTSCGNNSKRSLKTKVLEMNFAKLKRNRKMFETETSQNRPFIVSSAMNTTHESIINDQERIIHHDKQDIVLHNSILF